MGISIFEFRRLRERVVGISKVQGSGDGNFVCIGLRIARLTVCIGCSMLLLTRRMVFWKIERKRSLDF